MPWWSLFCFLSTAKKDKVSTNLKENKDPYGLHILYPPEGPESPQATGLRKVDIDIIAVHGLDGHPFLTWTETLSKSNWLKEFLPNTLPNARIMTFGYNSVIKFSDSVSTIEDFAKELLYRIHMERQKRQTDNRPLIFICHSLGGIVVKKALILANEGGERFEFIKKSCRGIIFLGTPHRGSKAADLGKILSDIVNSLTLSTAIRTPLLNDLRSNSGVLQTISKQFVMRSRDLQVVSFYERERMRSGPLSVLVVDEDSATIGTVNEITVPINANHHEMCKFSNEECPRYDLVKGAIVEMARKALGDAVITISQEDELYEQILEWLSPEPTEPLESIYESKLDEREDGTCSWFWRHDDVKSWLSGDSSILWVHGPPGVGKSVLCSSIISKLREEEKVVAYFFCVSSQQSEQDPDSSTAPKLSSAELVFRSLIAQLLESDTFCRIPNKLKDLYKRRTRPKRISCRIQFEDLKTILQSILDITPRAYIIIDGLDEIDSLDQDNSDQLRKLLKALDLKTLGIVKWLLVSQKTKAVDESLSLLKESSDLSTEYRELDLAEVDSELREEIREMIKTVMGRYFSDDAGVFEPVLSLLVGLTGGNFLCANLLLEDLHDCPSLDDLIELIREYQPGLENHYIRALKRMASVKNQNWVDATKKTLMFITLALKPLTVCEIQAVLSVDTTATGGLSGKSGMFPKAIEKLCLPLVRVCPQKRTMKLVHHSVRAFLMKQLGKPETWNTDGIEGFFIDEKKGHAIMALVCLSYLSQSLYSDFPALLDNSKSLEAISTMAMVFDEECERERSRFMKYAAIFWHSHADAAEVTPNLVEVLMQFLRSRNFITCLRARSISAPYHFGTFISLDGSYTAFADTVPGWLETTNLLPGSKGTEMAFQYYSFIKEWGHILTRYPGEIERCLIGTLGKIFFSKIKTTADAYLLDDGETVRSTDVDSSNHIAIAHSHDEGWILTLKIKLKTIENNQSKSNDSSQIARPGGARCLGLWCYDQGSKLVPQPRWSLPKDGNAPFGGTGSVGNFQLLNCCEHPQKSNLRIEWPLNLSPLIASPALDYVIIEGHLFKLRNSESSQIRNIQDPLMEFKFPSILCTPLGISLGTRGRYLAIGAAWECHKCYPDDTRFEDDFDDTSDSDSGGSSGFGSDADEVPPFFAGTSFASASLPTTYAYFQLLIYDSLKLETPVALYELGAHCRTNNGGNPFGYASPAFHPNKSLIAWAPGPGEIVLADFETKSYETHHTTKMSRKSYIIARELRFSQREDFFYEIKITVMIAENSSFHRGKVLLTKYPLKGLSNYREVQHFNWKLRYPGAKKGSFKPPTTSWTADNAYISFSNMGLSVFRIDLHSSKLYTASTSIGLPSSALQRSVSFISVNKKDAIVVLGGSIGYGPSLISAKGVDWDERSWGSEIDLTIKSGMDPGVFYECDEASFIVPVRSGAVWTERTVLKCR